MRLGEQELLRNEPHPTFRSPSSTAPTQFLLGSIGRAV